MKAEILCIGTELLLGNIVNTNAQYLSEQLANAGVSVYYHTVVGDNPERLKKALEIAYSRADMVITTGGLGPTQDDLSKQSIGEFFNREIFFNTLSEFMTSGIGQNGSRAATSEHKSAYELAANYILQTIEENI